MAGALLRSGSLSDFHPLGAVGKPVYSAASQLRATIRRRYGESVADLFAIPKRHDQGDVIDWYAPRPGSVVPWSAATPEERAEAVSALESARQRLVVESEALQADAESAERKVFGRLLAQATRIPGEDHIYLVDGSPVITFWGFHPLGAAGALDVIGHLGAGTAAAAALTAEEERPAAGAAAAAAADAGLQAVADDQPRRRAWWWWLLPLLLLLLLLLLFGLRSCGVPVPYTDWLPGSQHAPTGAVMPEAAPPDLKPLLDAQGHPVVRSDGASVYVDGGGRTLAVYPDGRRVLLGADGLPAPQQPADTAAPPPPVTAQPGATPGADGQPPEARVPPADGTKPPETTPPTVPKAPEGAAQPPPATPQPGATGQTPAGATPPGMADAPQGTPLSIPEAAIRAGDTSFLNGAWRSITGLQDKAGNPVDLSYDFTNGQGPVTLHRTVGGQPQTCSGQVGSTMQDGRLTIDQTQVRCPDGSVFQKSKVVCTPGADGRARCQGVNENGSTYDVDIVK